MRKRFAALCVVFLASASVYAVTGGVCAFHAGCHDKPSYNACLNCVSTAGCADSGYQACWNWYRRFKPGPGQTPDPRP